MSSTGRTPEDGPVALVTGAGGGIGGAAAIERFGRLDAVVCARGGSGRAFGDGPVDDCTEAGWDTTLDLKLKSLFLVCRHAIRARMAELQPLTGDLGRPEDVAQAALYLATAPFATGSVLAVDGGWTAR